MYYFKDSTIQESFAALTKAKTENKLFGLLGILHCISTDFVEPNITYRIIDGELSKWLDSEFYLLSHPGKYSDSELFIKFSSQWVDYVKENFMKDTINVFELIAFLYKYESFKEKPSYSYLIAKFSEDYHLSLDTISTWFYTQEIKLEFTENPITKEHCKSILEIKDNTISLAKPFSVSARAGELTRAPFIQTLYAGMDSIKCLLILRDNIDNFYSNYVHTINMQSINSTRYRPYLTAIKSKPFLLLAGISGTGKSRIVRELARACWEKGSEEYMAQKPSNFEMIQVKPNWHDSSELFGYISRASGQPEYVPGEFLKFVARAWENIDVPHFLCLDEMNLAPVEQYFAEFLSVIESRKCNEDGVITTDPILEKTDTGWYFNLTTSITTTDVIRHQFNEKGISLPPNLVVVGTVNMDETTFSFSRKVLDRAMSIEMNEVDLYGGLTERYESIGKIDYNDLIGTAVEGVDVYAANKDVCDLALEYLSAVNEKLEGTPFKIAYRTRNEFLLYVVNNLPYNQDEEGKELPQGYVIARALDEITSMKILSRIEGDDTKVKERLLTNLMDVIETKLAEISGEEHSVNSISLAKLKEMKEKLAYGYTSFWS